MPRNPVFRSYTIRLRPLTPIHVWSGRRLIYGIDIVRRDNRACVVDFDRLPQHVVDRLLNVRAEDMARAIESYASILPCKEDVGLRVPLSSGAQVNELAKQVVPGSSLKGYMRTAVMYAMLKDLEPAENVRKVLSSTVDLNAEPKNVAQGLEGYFFRTPRPRKQGGFVDSFQQLTVSDPEVSLSSDCLSIEEFMVYKLPTMSKIASQYVVAVLCGELSYSIKVFASPAEARNIVSLTSEHQQVLKRLALLHSDDILLRSLKTFGCDLVRYEIERIRDVRELEQYRQLLYEFAKRYCGMQQTNCVIARIGYMTGLRSKTAIGIIKEVDPDLYHNIRAKMEQQLKHTWDELTIKLANLGEKLVGVGWCEICFSS